MTAEIGNWGEVFNTTIIGIHQVMMEDGRVLYWGGDGNGNAFSNTQKYGIYDPSTGEHEILEATHVVRMFCGAGVIIPGTDQVLIAGGNGTGAANGQYFDLSDMSLTLDPSYELADGRFYPTTVSLSTGQVVILGGNGGIRATPEIFTLGEGWRPLDGATNADLGNSWWYPRSWVTENGNILYIAVNAGSQNGTVALSENLEIMLLDPSGDGSTTQIGTVPFDMDVASGAVMYDVGKIVMMDAYGDLWYMDINGETPTFSFAYDFPTDRNNGDMTVLPDGRILINGGTTIGNSQDPANAILQSVIFDPFTGTAVEVDSEDVMRLYHSSTMLLADGTLLSMGGGGLNGTVDFMDAQIYRPDYLYNEDGTLADRPEIISAPTDVVPGDTFVIEVDDASAIARLSFVKTGAVTHSVNMEAGRMDLAFEVLSNTLIEVSLPENANIIGAGNWMLFAIDGNGVPSTAPIMSVLPTQPAHTDSSGAPTLQAEYFTISSTTTTLDGIDFEATPIATELVDEINENGVFFTGGPADDFAARYTGEFETSETGTYTFFLSSDDGSRLFINGQEVIDNDGLHGVIEQQVTINLTAGTHSIEVLYFERGGGAVLDLDWSGPGFERVQMAFESDPLSPGNNIINGTSGDEVFAGTAADDTINGNGGNDVFRGSLGDDELIGSAESYDELSLAGAAEDYTFTDNGDGTITLSGDLVGTDTLTDIDGVWFRGAKQWFNIQELLTANGTIEGTGGDDVLFGTDAAETMNGNGGSDVFRGSLGDDIINGNEGAHDELSLAGSAEDYTFTTNSDGTISVTGDLVGTDTLSSIEGVWFRGAKDWSNILDLLETDGGLIEGTTGDDILFGSDGEDTMIGNGGRDVFRGSLGNDTIIGTANSYDELSLSGSAADYAFTDNGDGTVTVTGDAIGTDTLTDIDGVWFRGAQDWSSIVDLFE